jgi:hypothetical protein
LTGLQFVVEEDDTQLQYQQEESVTARLYHTFRTEGDEREQETNHHRDQLSRDGDHDKREGPERPEGLEDEQLAQRAGEGVGKERLKESRVIAEEEEGLSELGGRGRVWVEVGDAVE